MIVGRMSIEADEGRCMIVSELSFLALLYVTRINQNLSASGALGGGAGGARAHTHTHDTRGMRRGDVAFHRPWEHINQRRGSAGRSPTDCGITCATTTLGTHPPRICTRAVLW